MRKLVMMVVLGTVMFIGRMAFMEDGGAGAMQMLSEFTGGSSYKSSTTSAAGGAKFVAISRDAPPAPQQELGFMDKYVWSNEKIVSVLAQVGVERPGVAGPDFAAILATQGDQVPMGDAALAAQLEAALLNQGTIEGGLAVPANLLPAANPGAKFVSSR